MATEATGPKGSAAAFVLLLVVLAITVVFFALLERQRSE
jgi:ABC-type sugar transport system permease subunit